MNAKLALFGAIAACSTLSLLAGPASADVRKLTLLDRLDAGSWELRMRDEPGSPERLCLRSARGLIQLRHRGLRCSRIVVSETDSELIVQYTCPGQGYGRTHIRRESSSLLQIDSQGIAGGLPFAFAAEARRLGPCRG